MIELELLSGYPGKLIRIEYPVVAIAFSEMPDAMPGCAYPLVVDGNHKNIIVEDANGNIVMEVETKNSKEVIGVLNKIAEYNRSANVTKQGIRRKVKEYIKLDLCDDESFLIRALPGKVVICIRKFNISGVEYHTNLTLRWHEAKWLINEKGIYTNIDMKACEEYFKEHGDPF